jgi:hypothetical protein
MRPEAPKASEVSARVSPAAKRRGWFRMLLSQCVKETFRPVVKRTSFLLEPDGGLET